jgi:peptidoglycan/LPS O-acetylase OafA/YrhL
MPALDGLRGIAILLVMAYHFGWAKAAVSKAAKAFVFVTNFGWTGVDLFFVLSGFLITGILLRTKDKPRYFRNFYARRVLRIFPAYYAVVVVMLVVLPCIVPYDTPGLRLLLASQGWLWVFGANVSVALRHGEWVWNPDWIRLGMLWSLAVEEHFYFVWPLLVFKLSRPALLRLSLAVVAVTPLVRAAALFAGVAPYTVYCFTPFRADALAMGGLLAVVASSPEWLAVAKKYVRWAGWGSVVIIVVLTARRRFFVHLDADVQTIGFTALACAYGALLLEAVTGQVAWVRGLLSSRALTFCGKYSFGAYLLHELLRPAFVAFFPVERIEASTHSELAGFLVHAMLGTALTFGLAVVSYELYEKRFLALKRYFT